MVYMLINKDVELMGIRDEYLFSVRRDRYIINVSQRTEGFNECYYQFSSNEGHRLVESSPKKILQRVVAHLSLHIDEIDDKDIFQIVKDLRLLAEKLNVGLDFVESLLDKYGLK